MSSIVITKDLHTVIPLSSIFILQILHDLCLRRLDFFGRLARPILHYQAADCSLIYQTNISVIGD